MIAMAHVEVETLSTTNASWNAVEEGGHNCLSNASWNAVDKIPGSNVEEGGHNCLSSASWNIWRIVVQRLV